MKRILASTVISMALTGCASIFNGQTQAVTIQSEPEGASISVTNLAGEKVHSGTAPATLTLKRGAGYFKSEKYTIAFSKEGYTTKEVVITSSVSGWFIGNLMFGGIIGMLAVDPATGGMYVFPETVKESLSADAPKSSRYDATLRVVSTDSLTKEQLSRGILLPTAN